MDKRQIEIDHCHAVCAELRAKLDAMAAELQESRRQLAAATELSDTFKIALAVGVDHDLTVKELCSAINFGGK